MIYLILIEYKDFYDSFLKKKSINLIFNNIFEINFFFCLIYFVHLQLIFSLDHSGDKNVVCQLRRTVFFK